VVELLRGLLEVLAVPLWFQVSTFGVLGVLLAVDLLVVARRPRVPSMTECVVWVAAYVGLAAAFAVLLAVVGDGDLAGQFVAGWLTEYSLSVDNLFVFVIIMSRFAVPRGNQQTVLMMGIILSLVLRGVFIALGAAVVERFSWVFYLFGGFLVFTAVQLLRGSGDDGEYEENGLIRLARRFLPVADDYDGSRLTARRDGRRLLTPMFIVFLAIGSTDLLFALDSIPAIFGLTQDPFVVFTATIFALMGLRQLYFLLGGLLDRLVYLSLGLSLILVFIGAKLILEALHTNELTFINGGEAVHWAPAVPTTVSLGVIVAVLALTTVASLISTHRAGAAVHTAADAAEPTGVEAGAGASARPAGHTAPARPEAARPDGTRPESRRPRRPVQPAPVARSAVRARRARPRD
jgi:tellurite resistance protein TerC